MIRQTEASECGLTCLAMVANHHGQQVNLATLRRRHPGLLKGATPKSFASAGAQAPPSHPHQPPPEG